MADPFREPYLIEFWSAKSSNVLISVAILSTVRKAARLAVYEAVIMVTANHQKLVTQRPAAEIGVSVEPCYNDQNTESNAHSNGGGL